MERQDRLHPLADSIRGFEANAGKVPALQAPKGIDEFEQKKFFKDQTPLIGGTPLVELRQIILRLGKVDPIETSSQIRKLVSGSDLVRQRVCDLLRQIGKRAGN